MKIYQLFFSKNPMEVPKSILLVLLSVALFNARAQDVVLRGNIKNYNAQSVLIYQCYKDSLVLKDSTKTDAKGNISIKEITSFGIYKVALSNNQFFYIINDGKPIDIKTIYQPDMFYNIATDSLQVIKSEENKILYKFQFLQQQLNTANKWLLEMIRLYPLDDPFHPKIEDEYLKRYKAMDDFVQKQILSSSLKSNGSGLLTLAYYQPVNPDWKQPNNWRDSILAAHYFDYFNPSNNFYLNTNILPEKIETYLSLKNNKIDSYGQPIKNEMFVAIAAQEFLEKTKSNQSIFEFCLDYLLKAFDKAHFDNAFLYIYDSYVKPQTGDCKSDINISTYYKEKANKLKNVAIGSTAPNFNISDNLQLQGIESEYTLLLFWATWCPHCTQVVPEIKKAVDNFNAKNSSSSGLITVAVSLDTDKEQWQKFVTENKLFSFLNFSEFKSWQSDVVKKYNVYATPTMFLLDKNKKIIAKPESSEQLIKSLENAK